MCAVRDQFDKQPSPTTLYHQRMVGGADVNATSACDTAVSNVADVNATSAVSNVTSTFRKVTTIESRPAQVQWALQRLPAPEREMVTRHLVDCEAKLLEREAECRANKLVVADMEHELRRIPVLIAERDALNSRRLAIERETDELKQSSRDQAAAIVNTQRRSSDKVTRLQEGLMVVQDKITRLEAAAAQTQCPSCRDFKSRLSEMKDVSDQQAREIQALQRELQETADREREVRAKWRSFELTTELEIKADKIQIAKFDEVLNEARTETNQALLALDRKKKEVEAARAELHACIKERGDNLLQLDAAHAEASGLRLECFRLERQWETAKRELELTKKYNDRFVHSLQSMLLYVALALIVPSREQQICRAKRIASRADAARSRVDFLQLPARFLLAAAVTKAPVTPTAS